MILYPIEGSFQQKKVGPQSNFRRSIEQVSETEHCYKFYVNNKPPDSYRLTQIDRKKSLQKLIADKSSSNQRMKHPWTYGFAKSKKESKSKFLPMIKNNNREQAERIMDERRNPHLSFIESSKVNGSKNQAQVNESFTSLPYCEPTKLGAELQRERSLHLQLHQFERD